MTTRIVPALLIPLLLASAPAVAKAPYQKVCLDHAHQGSGQDKLKDRAVRIAQASWAGAVKAHDGAIWANVAGGADCHHVGYGNGLQWLCVVDRRPCRMVSTLPPPSSVNDPAPYVPRLTVRP